MQKHEFSFSGPWLQFQNNYSVIKTAQQWHTRSLRAHASFLPAFTPCQEAGEHKQERALWQVGVSYANNMKVQGVMSTFTGSVDVNTRLILNSPKFYKA